MLLHPFYYIYHPFSIYITLSKFLTSKGFQRSNNNPFIKESGDKKKVISEDKPVKSKEKDNVEGDMNKMNPEDLVVEVSNLIEPPRDNDGNILYDLMSLNTGIYKKGDNPSTVRRQKNSLHCNELCPCPVDGCNFGGFAKWLGDDKRKLVLERMLNSYRKYKMDRSNTIKLNSGQHDFDMGVKDTSVQAKKQMKRSIAMHLFREHVHLQKKNHSLTNAISLFPKRWRKTISTEYRRQVSKVSKLK